MILFEFIQAVVLDRFYDLCEENSGDIQKYITKEGKAYFFDDSIDEFEDGHIEILMGDNGTMILDKSGKFHRFPNDLEELVKQAQCCG